MIKILRDKKKYIAFSKSIVLQWPPIYLYILSFFINIIYKINVTSKIIVFEERQIVVYFYCKNCILFQHFKTLYAEYLISHSCLTGNLLNAERNNQRLCLLYFITKCSHKNTQLV